MSFHGFQGWYKRIQEKEKNPDENVVRWIMLLLLQLTGVKAAGEFGARS